MGKRAIWIVRISAIWSIWVWSVLVRNMVVAKNDTWEFRAVHIVLAIISFGFAIATLVIARRMAKSLKSTS